MTQSVVLPSRRYGTHLPDDEDIENICTSIVNFMQIYANTKFSTLKTYKGPMPDTALTAKRQNLLDC